MVLRTLGITVLFFSALAYGQGRAPAVEDFVGIEVEENQVAPQGTESLYNLEQDIKVIESQKDAPPKPIVQEQPKQTTWSATTILAISLGVGLPLAVWFLMMSRLKKKASIESASNIEVLEKYRKEREKKVTEAEKKAS